MAVQPGLCWTWSETPKTGFLTMSSYNGRSQSVVHAVGVHLKKFVIFMTRLILRSMMVISVFIIYTVKFLKFWTPKNYAVKTLRFEQGGSTMV